MATAIAVSGCAKLTALLGIGGADLSFAPKAPSEISYRSLVESVVPVPAASGATTTTTRIDLTLKVRTAAGTADGWFPAEAEVADGSQEVDGQARPGTLAGQKVTFRINARRMVDTWQGVAFPTGAELFEFSVPAGQVKTGATWTSPAKRTLLRLQDEATFDRTFKLEGAGRLGNEDAWRISIVIPAVKRDLNAGGLLEFTGSGEAWIAKKDLRLLRATEVLTGTLLNPKVSKEAGRFAQALTLMDATQAPPRIPSALTAPAPAAPAAAPAAAKGAPAPGATAAAASGTPIERIVFVSRATGKREVWAMAPDGSGKICLSGFADEFWSPSVDQDGKAIACVGLKSGGVNVWTIGLLGGDRAGLTNFTEGDDIDVEWCCGGQRVIFLRNGQLWSAHRDGFNPQNYSVGGRVVDMAATNATSKVAVVTNELNQNKIVVVDVSSGATRDLFEGDEPSWSADGTLLAFRGTDSITVANADGSSVRQILKGSFGDGPLVWDPTGKRVAVTKLEAGQPDVYLVETAVEGKATRITFRGGTAVAISPAADRVAYLLDGDLWVATADGNRQVRLTADGATDMPVVWGKIYVP